MKVLTSLFVLSLSFNSYALTIAQDLEKYCKLSSQNRQWSEFAMVNKGQYDEQNSFGEVRRLKDYKGCRFDTPWIKNMQDVFCNGASANSIDSIQANLSLVSPPKIILFFIDGAADFNASIAFSSLRPVNLDGTEGNDLVGNGHGLHTLKLFLSSSDSVLQKNRNDIELHYHSGSGFHPRENYRSAATCATETKYYLDIINKVSGEKKADPKWIVMGYSNGGVLTVDMQKVIPIDLAFTIDPIPQTYVYPFLRSEKTIGKKISPTKRFINFYQDSDWGSLPGLHLRSKPIIDADVNYRLTSTNSFLSPSGQYGHVDITVQPIVISSMLCEFGNVMGENKKCIAD